LRKPDRLFESTPKSGDRDHSQRDNVLLNHLLLLAGSQWQALGAIKSASSWFGYTTDFQSVALKSQLKRRPCPFYRSFSQFDLTAGGEAELRKLQGKSLALS
jgi:hypothetical protein